MRIISAEVLNNYMQFRNETNRSLAMRTGPNVGREIIGHLRSGKRTSCSPRTATAIEKALNAPPGSLFVPEVTTAQVATRQKATA